MKKPTPDEARAAGFKGYEKPPIKEGKPKPLTPAQARAVWDAWIPYLEDEVLVRFWDLEESGSFLEELERRLDELTAKAGEEGGDADGDT